MTLNGLEHYHVCEGSGWRCFATPGGRHPPPSAPAQVAQCACQRLSCRLDARQLPKLSGRYTHPTASGNGRSSQQPQQNSCKAPRLLPQACTLRPAPGFVPAATIDMQHICAQRQGLAWPASTGHGACGRAVQCWQTTIHRHRALWAANGCWTRGLGPGWKHSRGLLATQDRGGPSPLVHIAAVCSLGLVLVRHASAAHAWPVVRVEQLCPRSLATGHAVPVPHREARLQAGCTWHVGRAWTTADGRGARRRASTVTRNAYSKGAAPASKTWLGVMLGRRDPAAYHESTHHITRQGAGAARMPHHSTPHTEVAGGNTPLAPIHGAASKWVGINGCTQPLPALRTGRA